MILLQHSKVQGEGGPSSKSPPLKLLDAVFSLASTSSHLFFATPLLSFYTTFIMADSDLAPKFAPFFSFVSGPIEAPAQ